MTKAQWRWKTHDDNVWEQLEARHGFFWYVSNIYSVFLFTNLFFFIYRFYHNDKDNATTSPTQYTNWWQHPSPMAMTTTCHDITNGDGDGVNNNDNGDNANEGWWWHTGQQWQGPAQTMQLASSVAFRCVFFFSLFTYLLSLTNYFMTILGSFQHNKGRQ